uniref:Uncharacterized protein n=1 Tax=Anopheles stephensi TaxID=30069 RepID=A0A182YTC9_ANOST
MKTKDDVILAQILREEMQTVFNEGREELRLNARDSIGRKVKRRFLGPYIVQKVLPNDRYEVRKLDEGEEGPCRTTTAGDMLKDWSHSH